jgi:hypothetical protein
MLPSAATGSPDVDPQRLHCQLGPEAGLVGHRHPPACTNRLAPSNIPNVAAQDRRADALVCGTLGTNRFRVPVTVPSLHSPGPGPGVTLRQNSVAIGIPSLRAGRTVGDRARRVRLRYVALASNERTPFNRRSSSDQSAGRSDGARASTGSAVSSWSSSMESFTDAVTCRRSRFINASFFDAQSSRPSRTTRRDGGTLILAEIFDQLLRVAMRFHSHHLVLHSPTCRWCGFQRLFLLCSPILPVQGGVRTAHRQVRLFVRIIARHPF